MGIYDSSLWSRVRRNHALEHATVHLLAQSTRSLRVIGRSDWNGFSLYGQVDTQAVLRAVTEGLARLKRGETWLAIHPRCGTNVATAFLLGGGATFAAATGAGRSRLKRILCGIMGLAGAVAVARPLGTLIQRHLMTTTDVRDAHIEAIHRQSRGNLVVHRVTLSP